MRLRPHSLPYFHTGRSAVKNDIINHGTICADPGPELRLGTSGRDRAFIGGRHGFDEKFRIKKQKSGSGQS